MKFCNQVRSVFLLNFALYLVLIKQYLLLCSESNIVSYFYG